MTDAATIQVAGADRLSRTLRKAAERVASELPTGDTAAIIQAAARAYAPKRSGRLSGSLYVTKLGPNAMQVGSALIYAPIIHYGWRAHGITANPFLTNAGRATESAWFARNQQHTQQILNSVRGI
jgi:hypothetical protein